MFEPYAGQMAAEQTNGSVSAETKLTRLKLYLPKRSHCQHVVGTVGRAGDLEHAHVPVRRLAPDEGHVSAVAVAPLRLLAGCHTIPAPVPTARRS